MSPDEESETRRLPVLAEKDALERKSVKPDQHFTQPPPRYTEASLVKKLEELGIGRPSTYASIMQVLQDRDYVKLEQRRFVPEDRGRLVTAFLTNFFRRYVEYNFTADLEQKLDLVSDGKLDWKSLLRDFWNPFVENGRSDQEPEIRRGDHRAGSGSGAASVPRKARTATIRASARPAPTAACR